MIYTERDLRMMLKGFCEAFETQEQAAKALKCDAGHLSKMLRGIKPVSEDMAKSYFNIEKIINYVDIK